MSTIEDLSKIERYCPSCGCRLDLTKAVWWSNNGVSCSEQCVIKAES